MTNYFEPRKPEEGGVKRLSEEEAKAYPALTARDVTDILNARDAETKIRQSKDRAQYVRQQKGHSWLLHWCVLGIFTVFIVPIYYTFSPNHYWHL